MSTRLYFILKLLLVALVLQLLFRTALYYIYTDYFGAMTLEDILLAFWIGLRFDLSISLLLLSPFIVLLALPHRVFDRYRFVHAMAILSTLMLFFMGMVQATNTIYFGYVKRHMGREFWSMSDDVDLLIDLAFSSYMPALLLLIVLLLTSVYLLKYVVPKEFKPLKQTPSILLFVGAVALMVLGIRGSVDRGQPMGIITAFEQDDQRVGNLAINPLFSIAKSKKTKSKKRQKPNDAMLAEAKKSWGLFSVDDGMPFLKHSNLEPTGYNVIIIALESWSYKYIDALAGGSYGVTPNLDAIISKSLVFKRAYSGAQRSIDGLQSILASIAPLPYQEVLGYGLERSEILGVGDIASKMGYETVFVQSSNRKSFKVDAVAKTAGYDHYYGKEDITIKLDYPASSEPRFGWDYETLDLFEQKLSSVKEPFMGFVFTGTTHVPYTYAGKKFEKYPHDPNGEAGFLNTLYYSDYALGEFISKASKEPWFKRSVFIITADHPLGAYGIGKKRHEQLDDALRVPLLIYAPHIIKPAEVDTIASQLDILPTVVDLLGFSGYYSAMGESLLRKKESFALAVMGSLLVGIDDKCHLYHSLERVVDGSCRDDALESRLLVYDYLASEALRNNRWFDDEISKEP